MAHPLAGVLPQAARCGLATPVGISSPPPLLGQHTDEVLGGLLGMEGDELSRLRQSGVV